MNRSGEFTRRYHYVILQQGALPLAPDSSYDASIEHRCTSALIWPAHVPPSQENTILTDPCFTSQGYRDAVEQLTAVNTSFQQIGWIFLTHRHRDHRSNLAHFIGHPPGRFFRPSENHEISGMRSDLYSGHSPDLQGLLFRSISDQIIAVVGDAILNLEWLRAWRYYWPNFYQEAEILQTWDSVAKILSIADIIIPGHGHPIEVTSELLEHLIDTFAQAEHAQACPNVKRTLRMRLEQIRGSSKK